MPFTAAELANAANALLDYHIRGPALSQTIQDKPILKAMKSKQKTFPGGKEFITMPVKGDYTTTIQGFSHDDTVTYRNPANLKRVQYNWYEIHAGISCTLSELKKDGISVVDSLNSADTTEHSEREMVVLTGLLQDKIEDMTEGWARSFNEMLWRDGTQDAKKVPGITSIIVDDPTTAVVGGLSGAVHTWWRNRALVGSNKITSNVANGGALIQKIQQEYRQLRRYGGNPDVWVAGSSFIDALETEMRANGNYSDTGFAARGKTDFGMADVYFKGKQIIYDPTLDDLGYAKRMYVIDSRHLFLDVMEGEDMKQHTPARPAEKYVMYRAMTWTGGLVCDQRNCHGVYEIA